MQVTFDRRARLVVIKEGVFPRGSMNSRVEVPMSELVDLIYKLQRVRDHMGLPDGVSDEVFNEYRTKILESV